MHAYQTPLTTNNTLGRSTNNANKAVGGTSLGAGPGINKSSNNVVRVAPRPKNPTYAVGGSTAHSSSHNVRQNHFSTAPDGGGGGGGYQGNLFATDYFNQQQQQQQPPTRGTQDTLASGLNTLGANAINFAAYQQPNYQQYAHTAPRNRPSRGPSPRNASGQGAHKGASNQSEEGINGFMDQCGNSKSLSPNPFLISSAAALVSSGQHKGKSPVSASAGGGSVGGEGANKKFNSLKSSLAGLRKTPQFYYSMRSGANNGPGGRDNQSKGKSCKRHQSFNQPKPEEGSRFEEEQQFYEGGEQQHTLYYEEQPLYENLTDSIQIHELSAGSIQPQKAPVINEQCAPQKPKHHQKPLNKIHQHRHHHQQKKVHHKSCDVIERNSIYRSDSGISNSSYECITPVPAPRTDQSEEGAGAAAGHECGSASGRKSKKKMPVYMNLATARGEAAAKREGGTDTVDGMLRPAVNSITNTNPAEVCALNYN